MKICFIAPSGYGKTTACNLISKQYKTKLIKIATPLYELQEVFYNKIGTKMNGEQDGELLQFLGIKIRKENPDFLLNTFKKELEQYKDFDGIILNDDCRPPDYTFLKKLGFIFVQIVGFNRNRKDHSPIDRTKDIEWQSEIPCHYKIENLDSIQKYEDDLLNLIAKIKGEYNE